MQKKNTFFFFGFLGGKLGQSNGVVVFSFPWDLGVRKKRKVGPRTSDLEFVPFFDEATLEKVVKVGIKVGVSWL